MENKGLTEKQIRRLTVMFTLFALSYFICGVALADTIKVAVIDTGFDVKSTWSDDKYTKLKLAVPKLCDNGTFNAIDGTTDVTDNHGHGTHIAGLIAKDNQNTDYCLYIIKYYDPTKKADNLEASIRAYKKAIELGVSYINYSGGGGDRSKEECALMKTALDKGIVVVAAAGNEYGELDKTPYYPAMCDKRIIVVENVDKDGKRVASSNHAEWTIKEKGVDVVSLLPGNGIGRMTGTSQATATITSKMIKGIHNEIKACDKGLCVCSKK